jgi:hypothetical protein
MCRSIKTLRGQEPPATDADVRAAALQFVRKLSGYRSPSTANQAVFDTAVDQVSEAAERLLGGLATRGGGRRTMVIADHAEGSSPSAAAVTSTMKR